MRLRLLGLVVCGLVSMGAKANHDTPASVLGAWDKFSPRMHVLPPAKVVRALPVSKNADLAQRMEGDAQSLLRNKLAVMVLQNGEIVFEDYASGATRESALQSYSVTKSLTALAVGEALCAGKIKSLDDPATTYVPQLADTAYGKASIRNLLRYTSGAEDPGGNGYVGIHSMWNFNSMMQHKLTLLDLIKKHGDEGRFKAGEKFIYNGLDSETLSLVVRGATGMSLARWFEETVWKKAGAQSQAGWYLDSEGNAVAEISFLGTARDFARVGLYVMDRLVGQGGDSCVSAFLKEASSPQIAKGYWGPASSWGLGFHVSDEGTVWMTGHGDQRVAMNPKNGRMVVINGYLDTRNMDQTVLNMLLR